MRYLLVIMGLFLIGLIIMFCCAVCNHAPKLTVTDIEQSYNKGWQEAITSYTWGYNNSNASPELNYQEAIFIIGAARNTHAFYVANPENCTNETGNVTYHKLWVDRYNSLENYIKRIKGVE